jgi:hypothetical protein
MGWVSFLLNCACPGLGLLYSLGDALLTAADLETKTNGMIECLSKFDKDGNGVGAGDRDAVT